MARPETINWLGESEINDASEFALKCTQRGYDLGYKDGRESLLVELVAMAGNVKPMPDLKSSLTELATLPISVKITKNGRVSQQIMHYIKPKKGFSALHSFAAIFDHVNTLKPTSNETIKRALDRLITRGLVKWDGYLDKYSAIAKRKKPAAKTEGDSLKNEAIAAKAESAQVIGINGAPFVQPWLRENFCKAPIIDAGFEADPMLGSGGKYHNPITPSRMDVMIRIYASGYVGMSTKQIKAALGNPLSKSGKKVKNTVYGATSEFCSTTAALHGWKFYVRTMQADGVHFVLNDRGREFCETHGFDKVIEQWRDKKVA